ncbi:MAG TPA: serine/threonine-protein kinase [Polyangiaceae bacterium]|nr:serine/threonine-protein kinase [Polyangiaceae bacterium]
MASREASFAPGVVLDGRYRLEEALGEGGMGAVWVARQIALEREVAIKVLHTGERSEAQRVRLRREALALAAVHHPAVVQVHDFGETADGTPYVVMELVRGESLADRLVRGGTMGAEEAARLLVPLLDGLAAVHAAGIVHHDIKPENILLAAGPNGMVPKLLDFGIASDRRERDGHATGEGPIMGTPAYMAPEQARGLPTDSRTDVWAVGVVLYELVAGTSPFFDEDVGQMFRNLLEAPPPYPRRARGLDGPLWRILMDALRKDVRSRTSTAAALRNELERWLEDRPGSARPGSASIAPEDVAARFAPTLRAPVASSKGAGVHAEPAPKPRDDEAPVSIDALVRAKLGG